MRMMLKVRIPVEAGNSAIKDGVLQRAIEETMGRIKPEAAYFTLDNGERTALFFFELDDVSKMPPIAEPLFMGFNAKLELKPVMNAEDLQKGLSQLG